MEQKKEDNEGERKKRVLCALKNETGSSPCGSVVTNLTSIHEDAGSIPGLIQWVEDPVLP